MANIGRKAGETGADGKAARTEKNKDANIAPVLLHPKELSHGK